MKIYELLATPDKWCQGAYARDALGNKVDPESERAVRWCIWGAMEKCYTQLDRIGVVHRINREVHGILDFNDSPHTHHADVIKVLVKCNV